MKKKTKILIALTVALGTSLCLAACVGDGSPYNGFDGIGHTVSVRYESNGGQFADTDNVNIVDVYSLDSFQDSGDNQKQIKLVEPGSPDRGKENAALSKVSYTGHFLVGWYKERMPRTNDAGEPLDENGVLCSVSGKVQGYTYSGKWDFKKDTLKLDADKKYSSSECVLTLYAAWSPNFMYTYYAPEYAEDGVTVKEWTAIKTYDFNPLFSDGTIQVPEWSEETGAINMYEFPTVEGKTFEKVYTDKDLTNEVTDQVTHSGSIDETTGVAVSPIIPLYTTWKEGTWFKIKTAEQLSANGRTDGCYEILADLDFTEVDWADSLSRGRFTGKILGNGFKIANVTVEQLDNGQTRGGLFGAISETAEITNVSFENIVYKFNAGTRKVGAEFGLFAGSIAANATIEGVTVSGTFEIGSLYPDIDLYGNVGILSGNGETKGISLENITYTVVTAEDYSYIITVTDVDENGILTLTLADKPESEA